MSLNDRKRSRADAAGDAAQHAPSHPSKGGERSALRPRAVNTAYSLKSGKVASAAALRSGADNASSSTRSSTSQNPPAQLSARGQPRQPLRHGQLSGKTADSANPSAGAKPRVASALDSRSPVSVPSASTPSAVRQARSNAVNTSVASTSSTAAGASTLSESEVELRATWREKRAVLESEVDFLQQQSAQLTSETEVVQDAIEGMLTEFEDQKREVEVRHHRAVARFQSLMQALRAREDVSLAAKQRALHNIEASAASVQDLCREQEKTQEAIVLATDQRDSLERQLAGVRAAAAARGDALRQAQDEEERMKDATYGLSGEVREMVQEMQRLKAERLRTDVAAMETEVVRRELYSLCEELKGSIRVYCRVKGSASGAEGVASPSALASSVPSPMPPAEPTPPPSPPPPITTATLPATGAEEGNSIPPTGAEEGTARASSRALGERRAGSVDSATSAGVRSTTTANTSTSATPTTTTAAAAAGATAAARKGFSAGGAPSNRSTTRASLASAGQAATTDEGGEIDVDRSLFSFPDRVGVAEDDEVGASASPATAAVATSLLADVTADGPRGDDDATAPGCNGTDGLESSAGEAVPLPYASGRAITIHQTRSNATSTGLSNTEESFVYDRVFPGTARQSDVYRDVEPLVRNAVDGYRVCVFAYGQTGSGKTFTMEGDLRQSAAAYGVTPRALQTILQRQAELAREGWAYELSCTFIEIYNDVIRDLFQSGSAKYEAAVQQGGAAAASYHTIKHSGDRTHITNVSEKKIHDMAEFFALYKRAAEQRSTAKTDLNDKSSRSHCIFTLYITGTNATIRQRSEGILCLVDLAGSERVNESGVQGKQFKEAVNINRSLLDLGKCIRALRSGAVVPWRNCKLTYLLQNYLGAKGGKMLMIVTVSNLRQHAPESMNSLRFAARVQETFVGTSVKRVVNMM